MGMAGERTQLASIHIYPVKAMRAVDLAESRVEPWGLAGDRRWLTVELTGRFISQREEPSLAPVVASYEGPDLTLTLTAPGHLPISIPPPSAEIGADMIPVSVWGSHLVAAAAGR